MQKASKYTIFKTNWGYFGLAGNENGLLRTCLPLSKPEKVKSQLIITETAKYEKQLFKKVQDKIAAYFKGDRVNFEPYVPIALDGFSDFCISVLTACRDIKFGEVLTYSDLAKKIGRPKAARAIGNALAKNPLPLIIPCHRVMRSDGKIGGFSAPGGTNLKAKLLRHEMILAPHTRSTK